MNIEDVKILMEEVGIEPEKIDEFLSSIEKKLEPEQKEVVLNKITTEWDLKKMMDAEHDWRKKASIAAQIISLNLE